MENAFVDIRKRAKHSENKKLLFLFYSAFDDRIFNYFIILRGKKR